MLVKQEDIIKEIWENVEAEEIGERKFVIKHTYKYRHDVSEVFPPWKLRTSQNISFVVAVLYWHFVECVWLIMIFIIWGSG